MKLAAIRIRGMIGPRKPVKDTMNMLGLKKRHTCVILPQTDAVLGMLKKIQNYVMWGEVSDDIVALLEEKRGSKAVKNEFKQVYFLTSPKKGYRKGLKVPTSQGGVLGHSSSIGELITRMV